MIFVTVGTNIVGHDPLVKAIDDIAPGLEHSVIIQIGNSTIIPKHCQYFRFTSEIQKYYQEADLVITCGGVGTIFDLLPSNKRILAINNCAIPDQHQNEILEKLQIEGYIFVCNNLNQLNHSISNALQLNPSTYKPVECTIEHHIVNYLMNLKTSNSMRFSLFEFVRKW